MSTDDIYLQLSKGAKMIKEFCNMCAEEADINLNSIEWSTDITSSAEDHILTINAESGINEIRFSREEIEDYPGRVGIEKTNSKIKQAINEIK